MTANEVLSFWFQELQPAQWFRKDPALDEKIRHLFLETHERASRCELWDWRDSIQGRLAEVIVLDQFSRNLFRGDPRSFSQDNLALALSQEAILSGQHFQLSVMQRAFLYMPFMHSESVLIHEEAVELFSEKGHEGNLEYEILHKNIIDRFGRFPHRNQILGRVSTAEEIEFLKQPGSSF
ncbi:MAG: DUF924 family protein [Pseudobdellovibrionaceae bacterium]